MSDVDPNFSIELAPRAVGFYMPGEVVEGNVCRVVTAEAEEIINGLQLRCLGRAYAYWTTREGSTHSTRHVPHSNEEIYFDFNGPLLFASKGDRGWSTQTPLGRGLHRIPFSFVLPPGIPSTYQAFDEDKEIKYSVTATLSRQWASTLTATLQIHVWRPTDLNNFPQFAAPNVLSASKTLSCCCFENGRVGFNLSFPRRAFMAGENFDFTVQFFNGSPTAIEKIEASLVETVEVVADDGAETYGGYLQSCLKKTDLPGIAAGANEVFQVSLNLMPVNYHPLDVDGCTFMKAFREILVEMIIPGCTSNLIGSIPIVIGAIPFRNYGPPLEVRQLQQSAGQQSTGQQSAGQQSTGQQSTGQQSTGGQQSSTRGQQSLQISV